MPPRASRLVLWLALGAACACNRNPTGSDGSTQPPPSASGSLTPFGAPAASSPSTALADAPPGSTDDPKPAGSSDDPKPTGSAARDPGRYRAPVVMNVRGGSAAQPSPIVVTIEVREALQAPATLALSYPLASGSTGRKSLAVSLAEEGTKTHTVALEPGARGPVRVTLDASDPTRGSGLHAERTWPEAAPAPPASRPPGPPGGRPPLPLPPPPT